jgi:hypothetical protein
MDDKRRITDLTPEQMGSAASFEIAHAEDGSGWTVNAWWAGEDPHRTGPAGVGSGPTIEQALADAVRDMTEDEGED